MAWITQRWGILVATLFAVVVIVGAYLLGTGALKPLQANAISPTALLQSMATKDSDHDGLPNWEEALYGTNPYKADTFGLGMTDGEAVAKGLIVPKAFTVPNTITTSTATSTITGFGQTSSPSSLTSLFAKKLLANYLVQKKLTGGAKLSKQQITIIIQQTMEQIATSTAQAAPYRTLAQIKVSGAGAVAMRAYAANVQKAFSKHTTTKVKSPLAYLQEAQQGTSTAPLAHIRAIAEIYRDGATRLAQMTVPIEVRQAHLEVINAYARMANVLDGLAKVHTDPVAAMFALAKYKKDVLALATAFTDMAKTFQTSNVILTKTDPGYSFVNLISEVAAQQQQQQKP